MIIEVVLAALPLVGGLAGWGVGMLLRSRNAQIERLARQVDWLTLEVERLRAVETECQALRAENERLEGQIRTSYQESATEFRERVQRELAGDDDLPRLRAELAEVYEEEARLRKRIVQLVGEPNLEFTGTVVGPAYVVGEYRFKDAPRRDTRGRFAKAGE